MKRKWIKRSLWAFTLLFVLMNGIAIFHAYKFTHFTNQQVAKTTTATGLSYGQKVKALIFGVNNPRPETKVLPTAEYETIKLQSNKEIECWMIQAQNSIGTVILFHGFSGEKSSMLEQASIFRSLRYNTLLVDLMGSGGSAGNQTTIGYLEAQQVKTCFDYLIDQGENRIYLFGTSMGAVAIMKSIHDFGINPTGIILECPFGSMYQTVCARFRIMNAPIFPMVGLLVFWGGVQHGFWAFGHNPSAYALKIDCPTLLLYGAQDAKVSRKEIDEIYANLMGVKKLSIYADAGHENYLRAYRSKWTQDIQYFLDQIEDGDPC